ncbi:transcription-repair coupling factor [Pseudobutyrivibrio sp. AR14]|uniref:transcription-repair coupling factor n=1 Tax=Pseudobutyrivibrio sp. AR14 TaxID=1520804 RepID=UPI000884C2C6|nr:transcription-repair coupling factor [Pseudobutyrivibrio sp. AR14]SCY30120.1 transcription-repair coupling factor [Pseudobutyrivibrio sp. AR14]
MKTFLEPFKSLTAVESLREALHKYGKVYDLTGCADKAHLIFGIGVDAKYKLIITSDELKARELYDEYRFYDSNVVYFPAKDFLFYQSDIRGNALTRERMQAIEAVISENSCTVVTTIDALMNKLPALSYFEDGVVAISDTDTVELEALRRKLVAMGYENVGTCEHPGEFAVRGGIIDVFPLTNDLPVRIELWGDEVDSIRSYDPSNQKSIENINSVLIFPAVELILSAEEVEAGLKKIEAERDERYEAYRKEMKTEEAYHLKTYVDRVVEETREWGLSQELETNLTYFCDKLGSFIDFMPKGTYVFVDEIQKVISKGEVTETEFSDAMTRRVESGYMLKGQMDMLYGVSEIMGKIEKFPTTLMSVLDAKNKYIKSADHFSIAVQGVNAYNGSFELLTKELLQYKKRKYRVLLVTSSATKGQRLAEDLLEEGLNAYFTMDLDHEINPGETMLCVGNIKRGFDYPDSAFVMLSDGDIFGHVRKKKRRVKKYEGESISSFSDLHVGDFVVHENYGLGIYKGTEQMELDKVIRDYIKIEYAKGSNLYVLTSQLDQIQKYSGPDGKKPKLNSLGAGTQEWNRTKQKVQSAVGVVAKELVDLYALRQNTDGFVYGPDTVWQREFEESFPYEETDGQLEAVAAIKKDMQSKKIMDRLICGDVGFGKTEVAMRAAFKAVQEGKQVAYLVPTTILAQQHYNNFIQRMGGYPVNMGLLCRFRTPAEQKKTIEGLKKGMVDIVIGTHRLLSKDIEFKDLGLLIIDEEQRFGVNHKERIKQMKKTVDVLSLSATPIPRTLHMSLVGIRDMSVLDEPPMERTPIQTFVFEYNEEMVREAIVREMARDGQVYYVFNRVRGIQDMAAEIERLVPEATVGYIHGQMTEAKVEDVMMQFINHEIDVLVATTIIEIGLDISNVNTIIIHDSDNMGLSQLYQLRGRVGRSNRTAYAFLMYKRDKLLKEVAEKRLAAIKEFTDLGSGFKIAMRDLEIRGAGNLLGVEQHGNMTAVGYDLYCKMLNEAVKIEKGEVTEDQFNTTVDVNIEAYLPDTYVSNEEQRIDIYKRIATIDSEEARDEMLDELVDRFGEPKRCVQNLLWVAMLRVKAHDAYVTAIEQKQDIIRIVMYEKAKIDVTQIPSLLERNNPHITFAADPKAPAFIFNTKANTRIKPSEIFDYLQDFLMDLKSIKVDN